MASRDMMIVRHRINTIAELRKVPRDEGVEVDIRECRGEPCLAHDPYEKGGMLKQFLSYYRHRWIIFNPKCDGLEGKILKLAAEFSIKKFFLLDVAIPTLVKLTNQKISKIAVRFSEYEPIESCLGFAGKAEWVWVDCFTKFLLNRKNYPLLKKHFKICLVSPELQGHPVSWIQKYKNNCSLFPVDAVCTDHPTLWQ